MDAHDPPPLEAARRLLRLRPDLAERELRRFLALYPDSAHGHALLGGSLVMQGRRREAVAASRQAVWLAPDWHYAHASLAEVCLHAGRPREAERHVRAALGMYAADADYHALLAGALLNQWWRFPGAAALRAADAGLALDPENAMCARMRAHALSRLRRHDEARRAAALALALEPGTSDSHTVAGWVEVAAGERARGGELLREALRLNPANAGALQALRQATYLQRTAAAMLAQAERWRRPLYAVLAVYAVELAAAVARGGGSDIAWVLGFSAWNLGVTAGGMAWAHRRHPALVEEMRLAGPGGRDASDARQTLVMMIVFLLFAPVIAFIE